jgi:hypothetical protein
VCESIYLNNCYVLHDGVFFTYIKSGCSGQSACISINPTNPEINDHINLQ